jgi:hypothetical protein
MERVEAPIFLCSIPGEILLCTATERYTLLSGAKIPKREITGAASSVPAKIVKRGGRTRLFKIAQLWPRLQREVRS